MENLRRKNGSLKLVAERRLCGPCTGKKAGRAASGGGRKKLCEQNDQARMRGLAGGCPGVVQGKGWKRPGHDPRQAGEIQRDLRWKTIILGDIRQVSNRVLEGWGLQCNRPV